MDIKKGQKNCIGATITLIYRDIKNTGLSLRKKIGFTCTLKHDTLENDREPENCSQNYSNFVPVPYFMY